MSSPPSSSPPRPRACPSGRWLRSRIQAPGPDAVLPAAPPSGAWPRHSAILAAHDNPRRTLWRWSRPLAPGSATANDLPAAPRHAASSHYFRPTLTPRETSDLLAFLFTGRVARFQEIKKALGPISSRVLSLKLSRLEQLDLVERTVFDTRPPRVQYALTPRGRRVARLGEPVFLYLRLTESSIVRTDLI